MAGTIYKRGQKTWQIRFSMGKDPVTGKRRNFNETVRGSKKDAEAILVKRLREHAMIKNGHEELVEAEPVTLGEFLDDWLKRAVRRRVAESTFTQYDGILTYYVRPKLGGRLLKTIKRSDVEALYESITTAGRSPRTVRYVHTVLRSAFGHALDRRLINVNPCIGDRMLPKRAHREMKAFSPAEAKRFIGAAKEDRHGLVFMFALDSGMRPEEYLALKWSDLDFEKCTATVQRTLIRRKTKGGGWYFGRPKTDKSRRTVRLSPEIFAMLKCHRLDQNKHMLALGSEYERHDLVFANEFGRPLDLKNLRTRNFAAILKKASLSGFRIYDLRHSMATLMLANGENPKVVSERLGHASVNLTLEVYTHVLPDMQQGASERLTKVLFG